MKIDAVIVGAHKCATTSLLEMLSKHPRVKTHFAGQLIGNYLGEIENGDVDGVVSALFPRMADDDFVLVRDTTLYRNPEEIARLFRVYPDIKLILATREPVSRAFSAFCHASARGFEHEFPTFEHAVTCLEQGGWVSRQPPLLDYFEQSLFYHNYTEMAELIPVDNIFLFDCAGLQTDLDNTLGSLFDFLGLESVALQPVTKNVRSKMRSDSVNNLVRRESSARRFARLLLNPRIRSFVLNLIMSLNARADNGDILDDQVRSRLEKYFETDWHQTQQLTSRMLNGTDTSIRHAPIESSADYAIEAKRMENR